MLTSSRLTLKQWFGALLFIAALWLWPDIPKKFQAIFTSQSQPTTTSAPHDEAQQVVMRVVDGDTIEMEGGEKVRLIGVDAPESVKPHSAVECFGKEASQWLKMTLEGKTVQLEKDTSERDRYGRLLRYVLLDGELVNELLVRSGYARAVAYPPDTREQDQLEQAETEARAQSIGIWDPKHCPQAR